MMTAIMSLWIIWRHDTYEIVLEYYAEDTFSNYLS